MVLAPLYGNFWCFTVQQGLKTIVLYIAWNMTGGLVERAGVKGTDDVRIRIKVCVNVYVYVYVNVYVYVYAYVYVYVYVYVKRLRKCVRVRIRVKVQITDLQPSSVPFTPALSTKPPVIFNPPKSLRYPLFIRGGTLPPASRVNNLVCSILNIRCSKLYIILWF